MSVRKVRFAPFRGGYFPVYLLAVLLFMAGTGNMPVRANQPAGVSVQDEASARLLSLLDLERPGLEMVRSAAGTPGEAARELLVYFRSRISVKHPVDRTKKTGSSGNSAGQKDLETADNALKHIFIGQPAYPPYFCGDDINWGLSPVPDKEWVWQLNRMSFWDAMALAYWHTGNEQYAEEWTRQVVDWIRKNPRDKDHDYAWRSIEAGIRGYRWTGLFQRFLDSPAFTPEILVAFLGSCHDHASYLMTRYSKGSNWALMEAEGLAFIAITFPEFMEAETWKSEAFRRLNAEVHNQVYPDGHQRELAIGYHMGAIGWFSRTLELARMNGIEGSFPPAYEKVIEKMCEVPLKLGLPDGTNTQFGDSWKGKPGQYRSSLKQWAELFHRDDFLYVATEGKEGKKPAETAFALDKSGLYSMRSGWDSSAICLVLKCGPDGGGHCQPDNGTFELYAGGRHLMPDAGSYIYSGDPEGRAWFRQTKVHQTITLDGKNSSYAPSLLLWKPGKKLDILVVENAGYPGLVHRRALFFVDKKYFVIVDEAYGNATGEIDLHFQFAPGKAEIDPQRFYAETQYPVGWNLLVHTAVQKNMTMEEEDGQVSFEYTKKEPRPAFRFRIRKESGEPGVRFVTVVAPYNGDAPQINASLSGHSPFGERKLNLTLSENGRSRKLGYRF